MVCVERMLHKSHILILSFIGTPFNLPVLDAEFSRLAFPETLFFLSIQSEPEKITLSS